MLLLSSLKKIAVFRALQLGDLLCAVPAIRALRHAHPSAEITLIGLPWSETLLRRFPAYFDRFLHFPGYPGLPEQGFDAWQYEQFVKCARKENFELLLQMQGNGTIVNEMLTELMPQMLAGFSNRKCQTTNSFFIPYPDHLPEIRRHLLLMSEMGIPACGEHLEFPLYPSDAEALETTGFSYEPDSYICIHPGSRNALRQWPPHHFALIADYCAARGFKIVLTGTSSERNITTEVKRRMKAEALDLAGQTTPGAAALLIKQAAMLFANCTGVSHIAAAVATPSVIISMDGQAERWAPLNYHLHRVIDWTREKELSTVLDQVEMQLSLRQAVSKIY